MPSPRKRKEMKAKQGRLDSYQAKATGQSVEKAEVQIEESAPEVIEAVETEEIVEEVQAEEEVKEEPKPKAKSKSRSKAKAKVEQSSEE